LGKIPEGKPKAKTKNSSVNVKQQTTGIIVFSLPWANCFDIAAFARRI